MKMMMNQSILYLISTIGMFGWVTTAFTPLPIIPTTSSSTKNTINQQQQQQQTEPILQRSRKLGTVLFIDKWVADMIDQELYRQGHKKEYEAAWMAKNRNAVLKSIQHNTIDNNNNSNENYYASIQDDRMTNQRQLLRDRNLASTNPQQYCADRCIATGNCDAYEDIFDFSPEEVVKFCSDCVLSEDEEPCDVPDTFYDIDKLKP